VQQLKAAVQAILDRRRNTEKLQKAEQQEARDRAAQLDGQLQAARAQRQGLLKQAESLRVDLHHGLQDALGEVGTPARSAPHRPKFASQGW
jgi:hypothetical protein